MTLPRFRGEAEDPVINCDMELSSPLGPLESAFALSLGASGVSKSVSFRLTPAVASSSSSRLPMSAPMFRSLSLMTPR